MEQLIKQSCQFSIAREVGRVCPLCGAGQADLMFRDAEDGDYYQCGICRLVFLASEWHPDSRRERERYSQHKNLIEDAGYCQHLCRLLDSITLLLPAGASGLDYGCGPTTVLAELMRRRGFSMDNFDPVFSPDRMVFERQYDFVTCSESVEHFHSPADEFEQMKAILKPTGILGIMTNFWREHLPFKDWWYRRDYTHVCFYAPATVDWLAEYYSFDLIKLDGNVAVLRNA